MFQIPFRHRKKKNQYQTLFLSNDARMTSNHTSSTHYLAVAGDFPALDALPSWDVNHRWRPGDRKARYNLRHSWKIFYIIEMSKYLYIKHDREYQAEPETKPKQNWYMIHVCDFQQNCHNSQWACLVVHIEGDALVNYYSTITIKVLLT